MKGKAASLTKGMKSGKPSQNGKKSYEKLKNKTQKLPLNQALLNTLNTSSPP
jgi:hypothetical protein